MLNRTVLIGRLTRDPELRYTPNGHAVANFTLAVDRQFSGEEEEADFIPIVVWRQLAETVANYMRKGRLVAVDGRIQTRHYENDEGRRVYVTEVIGENVRFLDSKKEEEEAPPAPPAPPAQPARNNSANRSTSTNRPQGGNRR